MHYKFFSTTITLISLIGFSTFNFDLWDLSGNFYSIRIGAQSGTSIVSEQYIYFEFFIVLMLRSQVIW